MTQSSPPSDATAPGNAPGSVPPAAGAEAAAGVSPEAPPEAAPDAADLLVRCAGLTKVFRDFWLRNRVKAVDAIDLAVRRGEVFGLLGPNGSGKSTTIKMILGLLHPTAGRIAVFGKHPREVAIKEDIGYLPEESYLYKFLNARETLDYYGRLFHQHRRTRHQRIDQLLEYVGLDKVASRPVGEYSKGMARRIGLAQALINDPQLLILDEPTTGMDPIGTRQIKDLILDLKSRGKTVLLCSHLLADVEDVTDRVAIMFGGKVRRAGRIDDLLVRQDMTTLQAAGLEEADIEAVARLLEQRGKVLDKADRPRQRLEQLFLEIVHEAQAQGLATSGASSGGRLAAFLAGEKGSGEGEGEAEGEAVIHRLTRADDPEAAAEAGAEAGAGAEARGRAAAGAGGSTPPAGGEPTSSSVQPGEQPTGAGADEDLIGELTGDKPKAPTGAGGAKVPPKPGPVEPDKAGERGETEADQGVIDDLLE